MSEVLISYLIFACINFITIAGMLILMKVMKEDDEEDDDEDDAPSLIGNLFLMTFLTVASWVGTIVIALGFIAGFREFKKKRDR